MKKPVEDRVVDVLESLKRDVTQGKDVDLHEVSRRIMALTEEADVAAQKDTVTSGHARAEVPPGFLPAPG